jgi:processive 1,2-diacylglycerol beta-glucosyltransferase
LVREHAPDVIVSTDPRVSVVLGHLRMRGRIAVPVYATVTDLGGIEFWVHPGVDTHLVTHPGLLAQVERLAGHGAATLVRPPVHPRFYLSVDRAEARACWNFAPEAKVVLLSGGGWGAGNLGGALEVALDVPGRLVVCLCGRNQALKTDLEATAASLDDGRRRRVRILGFTDRVDELMAAADVLVHSTGGATFLEASVRRCPVVVFGPPPGHTRRMARAMADLGEASYARSKDELREFLAEALSGTRPIARDPRYYPRPADVILAARTRCHSWSAFIPWIFPSLTRLRALERRTRLRRNLPMPEES